MKMYAFIGFLLGWLACAIVVGIYETNKKEEPTPIPATILHYHVLDKSACQRPV